MLNAKRFSIPILTAALLFLALGQPAHADFSSDINSAVGTTGLTWTTGGNASWLSQAITYYDNGSAAQSGPITHSQSTWMQTTVNGPVNLSFWWKVSSESCCDYLSFSIDGVEQSGKISGLPGWAQKTYVISAGAHTLKWTYYKDGSVSTGSDAGWVDNITLIPPDYTPPTTTATPAGTVFTTTPQDITLTCSDGTGSGCGNIYYTTDGTIPSYPISGTTQTAASPVTVSITSTTAPTPIKFFARDIAGNIESVKTETYFIDLSSVTAGTVVINNGDPNTTNPIAALALTCTDSVSTCTDMKLSNDGYTWSAPVSYATSTAWTLSPGDGLKTVYAMFSDSTGTWSRPYSDTIAFDTTPPVNGRWHWRNPVPQGNDLYGSAYGNSTYVTVGALGTTLTSSDGLTWATGFSGTSYTLSNVTFGNGTFVAVGGGGTILTSATGTTWTSRTAGTTNNLQDVIFSNSTFVAVGGGGTILTSPDGTTWTSRTSSTSHDLNKITYGNSVFVAVGSAGTILTSGDGTTWTNRTLLTAVNLGGVAFGNGTFVAVELAGNTILTSTDGTTWTSGVAGSYLYGVAFGNNTFVTVGYYPGDLLTSADGLIWTPAGTSFGPLFGVTYINGAFMAVGWAGAIYTSPNGLTPWTAGSGISATTLYGAAFGNNTFVAVGVGAILASSDGAATWTNTNTPAVGPNDWQYGVGFGNNTFVALQGRAIFLTSTDAFNWSKNSSYGGINQENNFSVAYGNNAFVAVGNTVVGYGPQIYTSSDGASTWSLQYPPISQYLHGVTFGNNTFVAVGGGGTILTSTDGFTWTIRSSGTTNNLAAVAFGNNMFVAVGGISNSTILTSTDGITWTPRNSGTGAWLNGVAFGNNMFVAVGEGGTILVSGDGITWTNSGSGTVNRLNGVTFGNASFVVVGDNGTILQSDQYLGSTLTIAINNNAGATNSASVILTLSCVDAGSGCAEMKFSNDNSTYSAPVAYAASMPWTLTPGGGAKSVSVMFRDFYTGTWSEPVSANIVLDTTAPLTRASTPGGLFNAPQDIALSCNDGAGGGCSQTYYTLDGSDPTTGSTVYSGGYITINATTTLKFFSVDVFGQSEAVRTEVYTIDMAAPTTVASPPAGVYTSAQNVSLTANESSTIYYTTDGTMPTDPVSGTTQTALSPALVSIPTTTMLTFFAKDLAGNIETTVKTAAYIIDLTTIIVSQTTVTINNNDLYTNSTSATLGLTCTDPGFACSNMRISNDGTNWSADEPYAPSKLWQLAAGDGLKTVSVMFQDHAGNWSRPYSDTITLDTIPPTSAAAGIPEVWNWRNPSPQGNSLVGITYGNGVFVAVGNGGAIITSTDGVTWTYRTSGTTYSLNSVTYGNGVFVAVGSYDAGGTQPAIVTSTDGINWTKRTSGVYNVSLMGVAFNGTDTFVAVGWYGTIIKSTDNGSTWSISSATNYSAPWLNGVAFGNGLFVAVGDSGTIRTSANGTDWTTSTSGDTHDSLAGVTYGNGIFVVVGYNYYSVYGMIVTLPDGGSWTKSILGSTDQFTGVAYINNRFVATGFSRIRISTDNGTTWTDATSGVTGIPFGVAFGISTYVAVGDAGVILTSSNAADWTSRNSGTVDDRTGVAFGNNTFVSVGYSGTILTSTTGTAWTSRNSYTSNDFYGAAYGNGIFVAVGAGSECSYTTAYSDDGGITWTSNEHCTSESMLNAVTFGNGTFVAVGNYGTIVTSTNGIDWISRSLASGDSLYGVAFGNGVFVAVGGSGAIFTSPNGIDWTSRDPSVSRYFYGVTYGNNTFVVVGDGGDGGRSIITSGDGITWTTRISTYDLSTLYGITFGSNGSFVAVGGSGAIFTSTDGTAWTNSTSVTSATLKGVVFGNSTFVAVGSSGTILQSDSLSKTKNMINGGAQFTNTTSVTLSLFCIDIGSGCAEMQLSNDGTAWQAPESYATSKTWTLIAGDGLKTVYVKFKDNAGNWSDAESDTIILDSAYIPAIPQETFNSGSLPSGWTVIDHTGNGGWRFDDPGARGNLTGGSGGFAVADSGDSTCITMNTELVSPSYDLTGKTTAVLLFRSDFYYGGSGEIADVDVNIDGDGWTNVWKKTGASARGPRTETINIAAAAGHANVRVRFHYYNADCNYWWQVDDVRVVQGTQPTVISYTPSNGAANVSPNVTPTAFFSEAMDPASITNNSFTLLRSIGISTIAAGGWHNAALKNDGTVVAWGDNYYGQSIVPAGLTNVTAIAAGSDFTVALKSDATVTAWGYNGNGETNVPAGLTDVIAIAAGSAHTVALKSNGTVTAWGWDYYGQSTVPISLPAVTAVAAGYYHTVALKSDATVTAWGYNGNGQSTVPADLTNVIAVAAGYGHTVALKDNGTVVAWGDNSNGQSTVPGGLTNVKAIAAGAWHTVALKSDGTVTAWGDNSYGQSTVPAGLTNVTAVAAGYSHTLALKDNGTIVAWGDNSSDQSTVPASVYYSSVVAGAVAYDSGALSATFTPSAPLLPGNSYLATVYGSNPVGIPLANPTVWSFMIALGDTTPPTVTSTSPVNGATNVPVSTVITVTFSEDMLASSITSTTFTLTGPSGAVTGSIIASGPTATFTPSSPLAFSTTYTATITTGAKDLAGNALAGNHVWVFTTVAAPADTTPPTGSVVINSGAAVTGSTSVTLAVSASDNVGVATMEFSNDASTWSTPVTYLAGSQAWTLSSGDGLKTVSVRYTDSAGNFVVASDTITLDANLPGVSISSPVTNSYVNTTDVNYTLNKDMAVGQIFFVRSGGAEASTRSYTMTGTDLLVGSHSVKGIQLNNGTVYTLSIEVADSSARTATATSTNVAYDTTATIITINSPVPGSRVNTDTVVYSLSEPVSSGDIVISDGMTTPFVYPLSGGLLTAGTHTVAVNAQPALVNGMTYTFSITNVADRAGNATPPVIVPNVTFVTMAVVISNTAPATKDIITKAEATYRLSEDAAAGAITFTWTAGTTDPTPTHAYTMTASDLGAGAHTVALPFTLVDGAFYTVSFSATDLDGSPATTVSNALVFFDSQYGIGPQGNVDNTDGLSTVNNADVIKLQDAQGTRPGDRSWNPVCDLDRNNVVDTRDLMILQSHYGQTGP